MKVRDQLLDLAASLVLFCDHRGTALASIPRGANYPFNVPLNSPELRNYLFGEFEKTCASVPNTAAYRDLLPVLAARAQDSPVPRRALDTRISADGPRFAPDTIYLHLGNDDAEAIEITASGWNVRDAKALYFRGARQAYPLPAPEPDGPSLDSLLENLTGLPAEVRRQCEDWMLAAMRPTGPYPILVLKGAPGSGKSTLARLLRQTIDPSSDPIPALPNTPRRFEAHAEQNRVIAFDHVSHISRQLSGLLCTAAKPILLTMTDGAKLDPELTSRAVVIELPEIHPENRRTEAAIFENFHRVRAQMLGALCTLTSQAMANLHETRPALLPRHADAAAWTAASPPLLDATPRPSEPRAFASGLRAWLGLLRQVPQLSPASYAFIPRLMLSSRVLCFHSDMPRVFSLLLLALPLFAGSPVFNGSFENPKSWSVVRGIGFPDPAIQHDHHKAIVLQPLETSDAYVTSPPVKLTIGKRYEVSGYVRTEKLEVADTGRTPIAVGAAISMASMPWDVHSESVGGSHDWARVHFRFVATRAEDSVVLEAANGASFKGKAWFEGIAIDEVSSDDAWPVKAAVKTYGPAYRYPQGGWIYLHIEGQPYERGYQHGYLMAKEIPQYLERCAADYDPQAKDWKEARNVANALFLRGFDQEILEEMKGIAEGASDAGAKWQGRRIDLIDMVTANTIVEMGELREALPMTPTGLEGLHLKSPQYANRDAADHDHCSAFAATGKATKDGKMIVAHTTWWPLTLAEQTNVMLDIKPAKGHRLLMQSYPGGIESGTDWYQNDAGVVLTETTIRQSPFNREGTPIAFRAREAIQYGDDIDKVVEILAHKNNGLYTNEWLIGDAKNNEIAMFELGTNRSKLWRSSKQEWFGGTEGFYWGCNNTKDLDVRLEYKPDPKDAPEHIPYVPTERDLKWQDMYQQYKGNIDEQFAFLAFRTAPLVSASAMDAKVVTADMASRMMVWAVIGKPNEREWVPSERQRDGYANNDGLYSSGYRLFTVEPSQTLRQTVTQNERERAQAKPATKESHDKPESYRSRLWEGWILPASDRDTWLSAGSEEYYQDLDSGDLEQRMQAHWADYRAAKLADPESPITRFEEESNRGAILLDALRKGMGDDRFFDFMRTYFAANTTKTVQASAFLEAAGTTPTMPLDKGGPDYLCRHIMAHPGQAIIVYGTVTEASANRYAAEQLQNHLLNRFEAAVPIRKDFEVSDAELKAHNVIFVGRPETNSAIAGFRHRLDLDYEGANFRLNGKDHASATEGLMFAADNPLDHAHMFLLLAGNSALETVKLAGDRAPAAEFAIFDSGKLAESGFRQPAPAAADEAAAKLTRR